MRGFFVIVHEPRLTTHVSGQNITDNLRSTRTGRSSTMARNPDCSVYYDGPVVVPNAPLRVLHRHVQKVGMVARRKVNLSDPAITDPDISWKPFPDDRSEIEFRGEHASVCRWRSPDSHRDSL